RDLSCHVTRRHDVCYLSTLSTSLFIFHRTAPTEIYSLSLHDALPISPASSRRPSASAGPHPGSSPARSRPCAAGSGSPPTSGTRSEEHTSELQSRENLVCRLLLEKKNKKL